VRYIAACPRFKRPAGVVPSPPLGWMNVLVHGDKWLKDVYQYFLRLVLAGSLRFGLYEVRKACL